mmetsp:Transcript_20110/g.42193  ORF Transcript_20110/g.42193 Transcript_20110/m.42193 type:complete len:83 (-) Transcript_20110:1045-1293(-)
MFRCERWIHNFVPVTAFACNERDGVLREGTFHTFPCNAEFSPTWSKAVSDASYCGAAFETKACKPDYSANKAGNEEWGTQRN